MDRLDRRRVKLTLSFLFFAFCCCAVDPSRIPAHPQRADQSSQQTTPVAGPATAPGIIKAQANMVLVDVIAADKKGNYIRDLESTDFHVYEDGSEQKIASFTRTSDVNGPNAPAQKHYLVLFFDDSTMNPSDQARARQAAAQFIEKSASADRLMAIADFGGTLRIAQNFTADTERLKAVAAKLKYSAVNPNQPASANEVEVASLGAPVLAGAAANFGARTMLLAIRSLAKNLGKVPGRKTLILFSSGFPLTPERQSELAATVDACNKANVAIYPLDVRGLFAPGTVVPGITNPSPVGRPGIPEGANLFPHENALLASRIAILGPPARLAQRGGGGGSVGGGSPGGGFGGGGRGGGGSVGGGSTGAASGGGSRGSTGSGTGAPAGKGGTTGSTGGGRGTITNPGAVTGTRGGGPTNYNNFNNFNNPNNPLYQPRQIIPLIPDTAGTNQQVLYALASGTGGFPIFNTNDFQAGLDKIAKELDEYYILGYVPPEKSPEGGCHTIKVKVSRSGTVVRARSGYCDVRGSDILAGKMEGKALETIAQSAQPGSIQASLQAPYFYTGPGVARVNVSLQIPGEAVNFEKDKGKYQCTVNILGLAYKQDGAVAARFSDTVKLDLDKKQWKEFTKNPFTYQNTFDITPGQYQLKLVVAAGSQSYAKYQTPLVIDDYNGKQFQLSAVALADKLQPLSQLTAQLDAALLEEKPPLVFQGFQMTPSPSDEFHRDQRVALYCEIYEPLLMTALEPRIGISYNVVDKKTNNTVFDSGTVLVTEMSQAGNPIVPVGKLLPLDQLPPGDYRLQIVARDDHNHVSPTRTADFVVD